MSTAAQIAANEANAQLSTGPKSADGKAKVSLNAVKTGLTGKTILLPSDDVAQYEAHIATFAKRWSPKTEEESTLVQSVADTEWRLLRIPVLEAGIHAIGQTELADQFTHVEDARVRMAMIQAKVFIVYMKQFTNLSIQEGRLRRQQREDETKLRQIQQTRKNEERKRLDEAAFLYIEAVAARTENEWQPENFGFEFTLEQVELHALDIKPDLFAHEWPSLGDLQRKAA